MADTKILIVDDDANICELLRICLEKEGYDTVIANDGLSAISIFKEETPDLVLLDIMMVILIQMVMMILKCV
jgi:DNA-binding response OmpR family regulator